MQLHDIYAAPRVDNRRMWDLWLAGLHQPPIPKS